MSNGAARFQTFNDYPARLKRRERKERKFRDKHHLVPRSRGGKNTQSNLLLIHRERHEYWHKVFGNMTIEEVIELLTRMKSMKEKSNG